MTISVADIRTAVFNELKLAGSPMITAANTIDYYHGEAQDIAALVQQMTILFPACLICDGGSTFSGFKGSRVENVTLLLVYAAKHAAGKLDLQTQIDAMYEAGKAQLIDKTLGLYINPLIPGPKRMQLVTREFSIYSHQFTTFFAL